MPESHNPRRVPRGRVSKCRIGGGQKLGGVIAQTTMVLVRPGLR